MPAPLFANLAAGDGTGGEEETGSPASGGEITKQPEATAAPEPEPSPPSSEQAPPSADRARPGQESPPATNREPEAGNAVSSGTLDTVAGRRRPARYGLQVQFESRPGDSELGRLVDSTIWINDAHPAFVRATASRSLGYHTALAVALALAPLAVEARDEHAFVTQFLAHWGSAQATTRTATQPRRKRTA